MWIEMIIGSRNWHHTPVPMQRFRFVHAERIEPVAAGEWVSYNPVNSRRIDRWSAGLSQFECSTDSSPNASTQRCRLFSQTECLGAEAAPLGRCIRRDVRRAFKLRDTRAPPIDP